MISKNTSYSRAIEAFQRRYGKEKWFRYTLGPEFWVDADYADENAIFVVLAEGFKQRDPSLPKNWWGLSVCYLTKEMVS
jgi:hypothetical protein